MQPIVQCSANCAVLFALTLNCQENNSIIFRVARGHSVTTTSTIVYIPFYDPLLSFTLGCANKDLGLFSKVLETLELKQWTSIGSLGIFFAKKAPDPYLHSLSDYFLAGLGRNQMYGAHCSSPRAHKPF